jgi:transposase
MQLFLPIFPKGSTSVSACVDVFEHDDVVFYHAGGAPIHSHKSGDLRYFQFVVCSLIEQHLCSKADIVRCFGVSYDSVVKWHKQFSEDGPSAFFGSDARQGKAHKIRGEKQKRIQSKLDKGQSVNSIAREEGLRESAIRYAVGAGH